MIGHWEHGFGIWPFYRPAQSILACCPRNRFGRALALLNREADEWNAESVYGFLIPFGALAKWLVEHVIICAAQTAPDDLLGEMRLTKGADTENVVHLCGLPV
jgi:hypothetical protein